MSEHPVAIEVKCPACQAFPGHPCCPFSQSAAPPPMKGFHRERKQLARLLRSELAGKETK